MVWAPRGVGAGLTDARAGVAPEALGVAPAFGGKRIFEVAVNTLGRVKGKGGGDFFMCEIIQMKWR